jgi:hypothetical protein
MKTKVILSTATVLLLLGILCVMPVLSQLPTGMVSYWKFDEGSGSAASDSVDAHHGTIYGATWTTGIVGGALAFDGVDDYVDLGNVWSVGTSPLTIALWFKNTVGATGWPLLIGAADLHGAGDLQLQALTNMLRVQGQEMPWFIDWPPGGFTEPVNTFDDQWHFVTLIRDTTALKYSLYWDGNLLAEKSFTAPLYNFEFVRWEVGTWTSPPGPQGEAFGGIIDEVAIYNRALTAEEIHQHYQNGLNGLGYFSDPIMSTQELIETIKTWNLPKGTENSLASKLQNAIQSLDNGQQNAAINKLNAFINEVQAQRGKKLTNGQADTLTSEAQRIINTIQG